RHKLELTIADDRDWNDVATLLIRATLQLPSEFAAAEEFNRLASSPLHRRHLSIDLARAWQVLTPGTSAQIHLHETIERFFANALPADEFPNDSGMPTPQLDFDRSNPGAESHSYGDPAPPSIYPLRQAVPWWAITPWLVRGVALFDVVLQIWGGNQLP